MKLSIGFSDFKDLREEQCYYIDKTGMIETVMDSGKVVLITRPRRFGKTLNLSMLRYFFASPPEERRRLFGDLEIARTPLMNQPAVPVIDLTLKDLKELDFESFLISFASLTATLYGNFRYLYDGLYPDEKIQFEDVLLKRASRVDLKRSLEQLSTWLHRHHQQKVTILIDEYDTPLHEAWQNGYQKEALDVMRGFLGRALKDNGNLERCVMTGILRVAKASIFSDLNNLEVFTVLDDRFSDRFGFTISEVKQMLKDASMTDELATVSHWYDGYLFGTQTIYNPWSVLNYVSQYPAEPKAYWINTSSNTMIHQLLLDASLKVQHQISVLLTGGNVTTGLPEGTVLNRLNQNDQTLWSLLVFSGYLKVEDTIGPPEQRKYTLTIPNQEIRMVFHETYDTWFEAQYSQDRLTALLNALIEGNIKDFQSHLDHLARCVLSYFDTIEPNSERVYHLFVLGMLVQLNTRYEIRSNREAGLGRYDVMLRPRNKVDPGILIEFKAFEGPAPDAALAEALKQIKEKDYAASFRDEGVTTWHEIAIAGSGKRIYAAGVSHGNA